MPALNISVIETQAEQFFRDQKPHYLRIVIEIDELKIAHRVNWTIMSQTNVSMAFLHEVEDFYYLRHHQW